MTERHVKYLDSQTHRNGVDQKNRHVVVPKNAAVYQKRRNGFIRYSARTPQTPLFYQITPFGRQNTLFSCLFMALSQDNAPNSQDGASKSLDNTPKSQDGNPKSTDFTPKSLDRKPHKQGDTQT
jgi:hypothetical protein